MPHKSLLVLFILATPAFAVHEPAFSGPEARREEWLTKRGYAPSEAPKQKDQAKNLVDELRWTTLGSMEEAGAQSHVLPQVPWSDSYWPLYKGGLANRYADPGFVPGEEWPNVDRYIVGNLGRSGAPYFGELSPAEKYDRLVGDRRYTLTRWSLAQGRRYHEKYGKVEHWMGSCDGWAPASFMEERAKKAVQVTSADGRKILFYPSDIHALSSLLWAEGTFASRLIGLRCNQKEVEKDANGRPLAPECLDSNPASWHLAIVNQLAAGGRPLVMDEEVGHEVWNYPAHGYRFQYLGAEGETPLTKWQEALRPLSEEEKARVPRAEGATGLVTVVMEVDYATPSQPAAVLETDPSKDQQSKVTYKYELEVNEAGEILGGEWLQSEHPDFLWVPRKGTKARSIADLALEKRKDQSVWTEGAVPAAWRAEAPGASAKGQPMERVVSELLRRSR